MKRKLILNIKLLLVFVALGFMSCDLLFKSKEEEPSVELTYSYSNSKGGFVGTLTVNDFGKESNGNKRERLFLVLDYYPLDVDTIGDEHKWHYKNSELKEGVPVEFFTYQREIELWDDIIVGRHGKLIKKLTLKTTESGSIEKDYWGSWINMATGDKMYVDSAGAYIRNKDYNYEFSYVKDFSSYKLDGDNVLTNKVEYYFREGGKNRSFTASVAGMSSILESVRAASSVRNQDVLGKRRNNNNPEDSESVSADENGVLSFKDSIAGDEQNIVINIGLDEYIETSIDETPRFDGENIGSIPVLKKDSYGFKTSYYMRENTDDSFIVREGKKIDVNDCLYAGKKYNLVIEFKNVGDKICKTSFVEISWEDSNLTLSGYSSANGIETNFSSVEPGKIFELTLKNAIYSFEKFDKDLEYVDIPVTIKITDSQTMETWNDSIILRFYRGVVWLKLNSTSFINSSKATLNGFFIYPDGRSKRFSFNVGETKSVSIPWSKKDYVLVFSGATTTSKEIGYSFGCCDTLPQLPSTWTIKEINASEPNNTTKTAARITDLTTPTKGYLVIDDVDFYIINVSSFDAE